MRESRTRRGTGDRGIINKLYNNTQTAMKESAICLLIGAHGGQQNRTEQYVFHAPMTLEHDIFHVEDEGRTRTLSLSLSLSPYRPLIRG